MEEKQCIEANCKFEVEYACQCISSETYFCEKHFISHCKVSRVAHTFDPIFVQPLKGTKQAILNLLTDEKLNHDNKRRKLLDSFKQNLWNSESNFEDLLSKLDSETTEINDHFERVSKAQKISKLEQDPILKLLILNPDEAIVKFKEIISTIIHFNRDPNMFCGLSEEIEKMIENSFKNYVETFLETRILKIEKILEENSRAISSNKKVTDSQFVDTRASISELLCKISTNKKEFEDWKKTIEMNREYEQSLLDSQFLSSIEDLNKKVSDINENQLNTNNLLVDPKILELDAQKFEILSKTINPEIESKFRITSLLYDNELKETCASNPALAQAYQEYTNAYHQKTSLYAIRKVSQKMYLVIYDTENETEEMKELNTPEPLSWDTCMTQLPNGEIFCYGNRPPSGTALIIDRNYEVRILPTNKKCAASSAIYFNRSIYCFGGQDNGSAIGLSERFDLDENRWYELSPMPDTDRNCHSIIFNSNILISGYWRRNLLLYSINSNSFTAIPFEFAGFKKKILVSSERLYLIECAGYIYENEIENLDAWKQIGRSIIPVDDLYQVYCAYNKESLLIATSLRGERYFKFHLAEKVMSKIINKYSQS